jgi:HTH-type transcriptional regulator, sugar sensing transcriptional regulator
MQTENNNNSNFIVSLEELGLSKYEAGAYLTMIGKGSLAASEIAYYANLPRTKVYPTLKKLEKKRLSVISQRKPLICSAISPEEAFSEIVKLHEKRLKNMKKIIYKLQKVNEEGQRIKGSEERRYFILDPNSALAKVKDLISNSRFSIDAILDVWGIRLMSQCRLSLIKAITNGVKIRLIISNQCIGNEHLLSLPEDIGLKIGDIFSNTITIDSNNIISINSSNGKAVVFTSMDILGLLQIRNFEEVWNKSVEIKQHLIYTDPNIVLKAVRLINIIENGLSMNNSLPIDFDNPDSIESISILMKATEKSGMKIYDANVNEIFKIINSALSMGHLGSIKYDKGNNIISVQSKVNNKSLFPWAIFVASYFKQNDNDSKIIRNLIPNSNAEIIQIKLSKPIFLDQIE